MKFGRYLRENEVAEWRRVYIDYRQLKKSIKKAKLEINEMDAAEPTSEAGERFEPEALDQELVRDLERGSDMDGGSRTAAARGTRSTPAPSIADSVAAADSDTPLRPSAAPSIRRRGLLRRGSAAMLTKSGDFNPKKWRKGFDQDLSMEELMVLLPPDCKKFFDSLDRELEKITTFYGAREAEAVKKLEDLGFQWRELERHHEEWNAYQSQTPRPRTIFPLPRVPPTTHLSGAGLVRRSLSARSAASIDSPSTSTSKPTTSLPAPPPPGPTFLHGRRPDDYHSAKSKLKLATTEYYRSLDLLKSYRILNRTGFSKALKKFEKATRIPCHIAYNKKLDEANFVKTKILEDLTTSTETAFANVFEKGNRKRALNRLRLMESTKSHHFSTWRAGMWMGISVPLLIEGLVKSSQATTKQEIPYWTALLQLFGAEFLPVFFALAFFLNLDSWHHARINYVLIFELDLRTRLDFRQYLEIPAFLCFVFSLCFWLAFSNFWPEHISPSSYPLAFLIIVVVVMLNPFPFLYPSSRWWMAKSLSRVITAGLVRVEFRDFFLGDELNSLYYSFYNFSFLICTYSHHWTDNIQEICSTNDTWASPVLASIPAFFRLGQSIRRWVDSDGLCIHLINAGKYVTSIAYFFLYFNWRIRGSSLSDWTTGLWLLFAVINSTYSTTWDVLMDWNLGQKNNKHFLLRPGIGFKEAVPLYYVAVVLDVLLRFSWVIYLSPSLSLSVQMRGFIIAVLEACRRIMWNAFRIESESEGNVDGYRATRDVPLPYLIPNQLVDEVPEDESHHSRRKGLFSFFTKDIPPLASITLTQYVPGISHSRRPSSASFGQGRARAPRAKDYERKLSKGTAPDSSTPESEGDDDPDTPSEDEGEDEDDPGVKPAAGRPVTGGLTKPGNSSAT